MMSRPRPRAAATLVSLLALLSQPCDGFVPLSPSRITKSAQNVLQEPNAVDGGAAPTIMPDLTPKQLNKLEGRLLKNMRETCQKFDMIEDGDHIMVCVSGGKDSATMLHLLQNMQQRLAPAGTNFTITAVHLNQVQPGYDGTTLVEWLDETDIPYQIIKEDTYSIVKDKTPEGKTYCSLCSRLRRGILYSIAHDIGATKIALGHHADDAIETLLLNAVHSGQLKAMPARYYSSDRNMHVIRPLMSAVEDDIRQYAQAMDFPILPCNLCGSQPDAHRAKMKMLVGLLDSMNPNAKRNIHTALGDVRPSHLLDTGLREACGLDGKTGEIVDAERAGLIRGFDGILGASNNGVREGRSEDGKTADGDGAAPDEQYPQSFIESLL